MNSKQISWHDFFIEIDILSQVHVVVTYSIQSIGHFQNSTTEHFKPTATLSFPWKGTRLNLQILRFHLHNNFRSLLEEKQAQQLSKKVLNMVSARAFETFVEKHTLTSIHIYKISIHPISKTWLCKNTQIWKSFAKIKVLLSWLPRYLAIY